jgi:hypothetical protein
VLELGAWPGGVAGPVPPLKELGLPISW